MPTKMIDDRRLLSVLSDKERDGWVIAFSFPEIAAATGIGLRSVPRVLKRLRNAGLVKIVVERGRGRINSYQITPAGRRALEGNTDA